MHVYLEKSSSAGSLAQLLTVILIFAFVLFITAFTTKYIANFQKAQGLNRNMEVIESIRITNNKFLEVVRAGNKYIVIGVGKDEITMLTEIDGESLIKADGEKPNVKETFSDIISKAKIGFKLRDQDDKSDNDE